MITKSFEIGKLYTIKPNYKTSFVDLNGAFLYLGDESGFDGCKSYRFLGLLLMVEQIVWSEFNGEVVPLDLIT